MICRLLIAIGILIGFNSDAFAQQEPTFTHYSFNPISINPAFAGHKELLSITGINRARWLSFPGSPRTQSLTVHSILKTNRIGGGFSLMNDSKGPYHSTGLDFDITYRMPLGEGTLAFGLKGGLRFFSTRLQSEVVTAEQGDLAFQSDVVSQVAPNLGLGFLYILNDFYAGFSLPRSIKNNLNKQLETGNSFSERTYYLMMGGVLNLNEEYAIKLKPSLFCKITGSSLFQMDATFLFYFQDKYWLGPMYRTTNDFGLLTGMQINTQFQFGYAFDWSLGNKTAKYNNGTHEFMLRYEFVFDKKQGVVSPRHF